MKKLIALCVILTFVFYSCKTTNVDKGLVKKVSETNEVNIEHNDTLRIANDELEYEIIIIEPRFNAWLLNRARQRGFYSQQFLENRNQLLVNNFNVRARQPLLFDSNLYQNEIDYDNFTDYGYEVNYLLYNYLIFFQLEFNQKLGPFIPRV